ncbi:MAG TPA: hypothetical protein VF250_12830 [Conexibacter sp.]
MLATALVALPLAPARAEPPPQRAWELVSPSEKHGYDVIAESSRTHAADGATPGLPTAVAFASLGGFADVIGGGIATEYVARRTAQPGTSGWSTHAITPPQEPMSVPALTQQLDPAYELFAPDLTRAVFRAWSPVTAAPNVAGVENLYAREDLRTPGAGAYRLLTGASTPLPPIERGSQHPFVAAATGDLAHVLLESRLSLTPDAVGDLPKLYKADGDALRLLAPPGGCPGTAAPADPCSAAGLGAIALHQTGEALSADGSRTIITAPVTVFGNVTTGVQPSRLYQLDDRGTSTTADDALVQLNASELPVPDVPRAANFQGASADGARVYFTSAEPLTADAPADGGLYLWERGPASATQRLTLDATGGTFTLRAQLPTLNAGSDTTAPLPHDASAAELHDALAALANVGTGNVTVSGSPGGPYEIAFAGALAGVAVPPLIADGSGLAGGAASASVSDVETVRNLTFVAAGGTDVLALGAARDGRRIYFATPAQLLPGVPPVDENAVYLWEEDAAGGGGALAFVGLISARDVITNVNRAPVSSRPRTSRVTPDGGTLLLSVSDEDGLAAGHDHGACESNPNNNSIGRCSQLYLYRAAASMPLAPALACVSCQPSGATTGANAVINARAAGAAQVTASLNHALSDDGRRVFFSSAAPLVPADANGKVDAYEYDVPSATLRLLSSGRDPADSWFLDASANGDDAFFVTRERLVGWDRDRAYDLYDARVDGGFPEPPSSPPGCSGDACRGQAHAAPPAAALGSMTLVRSPDRPVAGRPARKACRRGFVRRKARGGRARCVRKAQARRHARRRSRGR